jgi:hypothetical protein
LYAKLSDKTDGQIKINLGIKLFILKKKRRLMDIEMIKDRYD